ncbi:MAG: hypothetical protein IPO83_11565 [Chitinophagaceae bacterium]|nr:hypothetical protein [Chitinophagaceae bacterium]
MFKNALVFFICLFTFKKAIGQELLSYGGGTFGAGSTLYRDYQSAGVNPANLGIFGDETRMTFAFFDASGLVYSDALPKTDLVQSIIHGKKLSEDEKLTIAQLFAEDGLSFNYELMPVAFALQIPKVGGLSFTWKEKLSGDAILNPAFADLVFNGLNSKYIDTIIQDAAGYLVGHTDTTLSYSQYFNGSSFQSSWTRDFNISYGRKIIDLEGISIYGGIGVNFLLGNAITDISYSENTATGFAAYSSVFDIDYANITNPQLDLKGNLYPVGKGFAIDFGGTVSIKNKIFGGISVTNMGSMKWNGNLVKLNDGILDSVVNFIGVNSADIYSDIASLLNAGGLFSWSPQSEIKQTLPAQLRIGGAIRPLDKLEIGVDVIQPLNKHPGSIQQTMLSALVSFVPVKALKITTGMMGGGVADFDIPLGVAFSFTPEQAWQISIGTRDIISLFKQNTPTLSLSVSMLRFSM